MDNSNNYVVIMAGGVGSRFWPMSSENMPKQFLDIMNTGRSLLQQTVDRFEGICPKQNIWVVTSARYADLVARQLPDIPKRNVLLEPCRRNTAPCIAYVSWSIKTVNPNANIVVTPSDAFIGNVTRYREAISQCLKFTSETDSIVTLGIQPDYPATGYGYIEADLSCASPTNNNIYRVDSFREKPELEVALRYIRQSNYYWNAGIFIWNVNTIVNAFRVYQPEMAAFFDEIKPVLGTPREQEVINARYAECQNISVDYAIMERADEIYVYPVDMGWSDLGSWSSLHSRLPQDQHGNATVGANIRLFDSNNCIVHTSGLKQVVVQGLDGYIVAERDGVLLVCKISEEQRIKLFH
ncbi:MAG: mannose-1-phosphate guanylyltransferase [Prevotellaceae bacterium]|nr:mannose-1-phosphate guanylyltransferase [Prevotellaceae bacterium]MDY3857034.1 mannose-1-phosphate guanylyltransferase [Bacteroidaceae bacterium]